MKKSTSLLISAAVALPILCGSAMAEGTTIIKNTTDQSIFVCTEQMSQPVEVAAGASHATGTFDPIIDIYKTTIDCQNPLSAKDEVGFMSNGDTKVDSNADKWSLQFKLKNLGKEYKCNENGPIINVGDSIKCGETIDVPAEIEVSD